MLVDDANDVRQERSRYTLVTMMEIGCEVRITQGIRVAVPMLSYLKYGTK